MVLHFSHALFGNSCLLFIAQDPRAGPALGVMICSSRFPLRPGKLHRTVHGAWVSQSCLWDFWELRRR